MEPLPETDEALDEYLEEDDVDLRAALREMAREARRLVPSCVGLSLGLVRDGLTFTFVATRREVAAVDAAQYLDGGPCVEVATGAGVIDLDISDLLDEARWSSFALASAARGIASTLSLAVVRDAHVVGGINLYAALPGAFRGKHAPLAAALGATAEGAMSDADLDFSTRDLARRLPAPSPTDARSTWRSDSWRPATGRMWPRLARAWRRPPSARGSRSCRRRPS